MATANVTGTTEIEEIQSRMAEIRHQMHGEVRGAVEGVRLLTDWRSVVRGHPLLTVGLAAAAGYLAVPARRRDAPTIVAVERAVPALTAGSQEARNSGNAKSSSWSVVGTAFALIAPIAVRAAQNYAMNYVEQWLAAHPISPLQAPPGPRAEAPAGSAARPPAADTPYRGTRF